MQDRNAVCDYIIHRVLAAEAGLNHLKLQKLLYYVQAWCLAFTGQSLFQGRFQAWVHGPVNREIYDRFTTTKSLYSEIAESDCSPQFSSESLTEEARLHIDAVLDAYAGFTGDQLEYFTHQELPWTEARLGYKPYDRCERLISENTMATYYSARLQNK
ncbi:MAG: type II toxin-antitoxin system antitoxin SocA domain-containing protein [Planctomycetota bacterium]